MIGAGSLPNASAVLAAIGARVRSLNGRPRLLFAAFMGALAAAAFPPFQLWPLLLLGYAALVLLIDGIRVGPRPYRAAAFTGWAFGFGHYLVGLHWVGYAFLVNPSEHAWQLPFAAIFFPGGLALFYVGACLLCVSAWKPQATRILIFAAILGGAEYARGHVLTGFPWNLPGYGWGASLAVLQSASAIGVYGLSFLTLLFGASLALLADGAVNKNAWRWPLAMLVLFAALWGAGAWRLTHATNSEVPDVWLRIVQPDKIGRAHV